MPSPTTIEEWVIVLGDANLHKLVASTLSQVDSTLKIQHTTDPDSLSILIGNREIDLVVCDVTLVSTVGKFLESFREKTPEIPLLLISHNPEIEEAVEAMRKGAFHVLPAPIDPRELHRVMVLGLVVAAHRRELRERKRIMQRDLEMAQHIQLSLLPPREQVIPGGVAVSTRHIPAEILGGDFFDVTPVDHQHIAIVIADVSGHGVAASLVVVVLKTLLMNAAPFVRTPAMFLEHLNIQLIKMLPESYYLTCFYGILNTTTGELHYANCGHPAPFLLKKDSSLEPLKSRGFYLGLDPRLDVEERLVTLNDNDRLILFTDGLTDLRISETESYGAERLAQCLEIHRDLPASQLLDRVIDDLRDQTHHRIPEDDIALVCVEYRLQEAPKKSLSEVAEVFGEMIAETE
jgi:serine phosphatase RsbU (regulator of sigma subunit)